MKALSAKVCFVMDCTASMEPWLKTARTEILNIIDYVEDRHPFADIHIAFIGYRDHGDANRLLVCDFTDAPGIMNFLSTIVAKGGDDAAEDVGGAVRHAHTLDWSRADISMIYHIADAPAHGTMYHDEDITDNYPDGDPLGLDPATSLRQFARNGLHYTFVRITHHTDIMTDTFANAYRGGPGRFNVIDLAGRSRHALTQEIYTSMDETLMQYNAWQGLEGV